MPFWGDMKTAELNARFVRGATSTVVLRLLARIARFFLEFALTFPNFDLHVSFFMVSTQITRFWQPKHHLKAFAEIYKEDSKFQIRISN